MIPPRSSNRLATSMLILTITSTPLLSACATRTPIPIRGPQADSVAIKGKAKVTLTAGSTVYLESAALVRDSIAGQHRVSGGTSYQRKAIALSEVTAVESTRISRGATILMIGAVIVVGAALIASSLEGAFGGGVLCGEAC